MPNCLTFFRILLTPLIVIFIFLQQEKYLIYQLNFSFQQKIIVAKIYLFSFLATILFVIAVLTDFFDGYLARKNNLISNFGKI
ncbi:CDP-alcohol phosphatidyltransferase family protein [bacterium]|nr:CDP-alcohol phosphatidyltransferase family protein [bacterium]